MNQSNSNIISIRDSSLMISNHNVLQNLSIDVVRGETISIIGRSGCGKTTFLRSLVFFELFTSGTYQIDKYTFHNNDFLKAQSSRNNTKKIQRNINNEYLADNELKKKINAIRKIVGFLFQSYNLFPHLTVLDNLKLSLILTLNYQDEEATVKCINILKDFGLELYQNRYPHQLSGGQQQRVAICRALVLDPKIMLYDEPTSALDPELVKDVIDIMNYLKMNGMTQIVVTHSIGLAKSISDKIYYMDSGQFVESGAPSDILLNPKDNKTINYLNKVLIE